MVLEQVVVSIFAMCIGFGFLYLTYKRNAVVWAILATILFVTNVAYGASIPFRIDNAGTTLMSGGNFVLAGISLIFAFIGLLFSVAFAFELFKT